MFSWRPSPRTDAVRVQLYRMASSPNVVHTVIDVSSLLCWNTSSVPSAEKTNKQSINSVVFLASETRQQKIEDTRSYFRSCFYCRVGHPFFLSSFDHFARIRQGIATLNVPLARSWELLSVLLVRLIAVMPIKANSLVFVSALDSCSSWTLVCTRLWQF